MITVIRALIKKTQLPTIFVLDHTDADGILAHPNLLLKSYILYNMVIQMIVPRIVLRSEATYVDMWLRNCTLLRKHINLPYIILMCLVKLYSNSFSSLVYSNLFTKFLKRKGLIWIESKKFKIR